MESTRHSDEDRILIAQLTGQLIRSAQAVHYEDATIAQAVKQLHAISTDRHLIAHALGDPAGRGETVVAIAVAAGVDLDEARQTERRPRSAIPGGELGRPD